MIEPNQHDAFVVKQRFSLVVNEAVTNAVVHAFEGREPGTITLTLLAPPGALVAVVADDGVGMAHRTDSPGLGMGLAMIGGIVAMVARKK